MRILIVLALALQAGGCVLLAAGGAGYGLARHRDWCYAHTGNVDCYRHRDRMPMGFN